MVINQCPFRDTPVVRVAGQMGAWGNELRCIRGQFIVGSDYNYCMSVEHKTRDITLSHKLHTSDFIVRSESKELERKMIEVVKALGAEYQDYKKAMRIYEDFKRLRKQIGKPLRNFSEPEAVIRDLLGEEFLPLVKDIERKRGSDRRRSSFG